LAQAQNNDNVAALQAQIVALQGQLTNQAEAIGNLPAQGGISRAIRLEPFKPHAQGHSWTAYKVKLRSVFNRAQITTDCQKKGLFYVMYVMLQLRNRINCLRLLTHFFP